MLKKITALAVLTAGLNAHAAPMFRIFELGVQPDQIGQYDRAAQHNLVPSVTREKGTLAMHAVRFKNQPDLSYLFEIYQDESAYQAHINGNYYKGYLKQTPKLLTDRKKFIATEPQFLAEKPEKIEVKNNETDPRINFVEVRVKPEANALFRQVVLDEMQQSMNIEEGVLAMYAVTAKDEPNKWFFVEIYTNDLAYQAHRDTPHFQKYLKETADWVLDQQSHEIGWKLLMSKGGLSVGM